jgi:hypothetical protein
MWVRGFRRRWGELVVVVFGAGAQRIEAQQELGVAGLAALVEELFYVVGIFEVAVTFVAAGMSGNQVPTTASSPAPATCAKPTKRAAWSFCASAGAEDGRSPERRIWPPSGDGRGTRARSV